MKPALGISDVSLRFKSPKLSDKADIATALSPYISGGVASPNMLIDSLGELLGKSFVPYTEEWADKPIAIAVKEMELSQQATMQSVGSSSESGDNAVASENKPTGIEKADIVSDILDGLKSVKTAIEEATE